MGGGTGVEELQDVEEERHKSGLAPRKCRRIVLRSRSRKKEKRLFCADKKDKRYQERLYADGTGLGSPRQGADRIKIRW